MIFTLQHIANNYYRIIIKKESANRLGIGKKGAKGYFYSNEQGMFIKFLFPENDEITIVENTIPFNIIPATLKEDETTYYINSSEVCREIRRICNIEDNGSCFFDVLDSHSSNLYKLQFVEQRSKREIVRDKSKERKVKPSSRKVKEEVKKLALTDLNVHKVKVVEKPKEEVLLDIKGDILDLTLRELVIKALETNTIDIQKAVIEMLKSKNDI